MSNVYSRAQAALEGLLHDGMQLAAGRFGFCGFPENPIVALEGREY
jgi:3-oxoacid CoA-transferase subunit A